MSIEVPWCLCTYLIKVFHVRVSLSDRGCVMSMCICYLDLGSCSLNVWKVCQLRTMVGVYLMSGCCCLKYSLTWEPIAICVSSQLLDDPVYSIDSIRCMYGLYWILSTLSICFPFSVPSAESFNWLQLKPMTDFFWTSPTCWTLKSFSLNIAETCH